MKTFIRLFSLICVFSFSSMLFGQISNLVVNGSSTNFSMASGTEISWSYNLPVGGTATLEIWIDINDNSTIEPGSDVLWESFYQIDGQSNLDGPPDMDGLANGQIIFAQEVGLAPGGYIMSINNNNSTVTIPGTVTPIASPVFTISGSVSVPAGNSAQYMVLSLDNNSEDGDKFWNAITDASGNFAVQLDADTSGNPWTLRIDNSYTLNPAVVSPDNISFNLDAGGTTSYSGNNFTFTEAAAEINDTVKDENGNLLIGTNVYLSGDDGNFNRYVWTDNTGTFRIGFLSGELPASNIVLGSGNSEDMNIVSAMFQLPTINSSDILTKNLTIYTTNSTISGNVTLNGNPPNFNLEMYAFVSDTGYVRTYTDANGNYTMQVSDQLFNYNIGPGQLPNDYNGYYIIAHPGQTNVNFNFTPTDVEEDQSVIPHDFSLLQNFPNPFNPITTIKYEMPISGLVTMKVYDVLGNEVATLVNEEKPVGSYTVEFNASNYPSGIYFYSLTAGSFTATKKLILMK
ncbi:MAG: T9SS type A sorting domain-containing protein [Ignavibacteriaceae bacterium]